MTNLFHRFLFLFVALGLLLPRPNASAHAIVKESRPAINEIVITQPYAISLEFNTRIDLHRSQLILFNENNMGEALPIKKDNPSYLIQAVIENRKAGSYRLRWEVLAQDGHVTRGDIPFTLR